MDETLPTLQPAPAATPVAIPPRVSVAGLWLPRIAIFLLLIATVAISWNQGVRLRHWVWDITVPIRFTSNPDIDTGIDHDYAWGLRAAREGVCNQYEKMQAEKPGDRDWLDDPPLRLAIFSAWGKWATVHFPKEEKWIAREPYALAAPMLRFTLFMEAIGLVSAFLLTRFWVIRGSVFSDFTIDPSSWVFRCWVRGIFLVLLVCLNPLALRAAGIWVYWNQWTILLLLLLASALIDTDSQRWFFRGCIPGVIAALLLWFNPAIVLNAFGWVSWDVWLIPMFLLACLFASLDWWFTAGMVIAIGAMLNGQQVLAIPLLFIWSIIQLRPLSTARLCSGIVVAGALIVSPWLLSYIPADQLQIAHAAQITGPASVHPAAQVPIGVFKITRKTDIPAVTWVLGVFVAAVGLPWVSWLTWRSPSAPTAWWRRTLASQWAWRGIAAFGAFALVMWPWLIKRNHQGWLTGVVLALALITAVLLIRPRGIACLAAGAMGTALLLCMSLFHGSSAWYECAFNFGMIHWPTMTVGMTSNLPGVDNLPGLMSHDFGWARNKLGILALDFIIPAKQFWIFPEQPFHVAVPLGVLLKRLFYWTVLFCCIGGAVHARRRSPRVLIALTAIWLMFFCFPPSINQRYLVFAAGISCICAGESAGMTLLGILLSIISFVMTFDTMLSCCGGTNKNIFGKELARQFPRLFASDASDKLLMIMNPTHPDAGYAVILCGLIFLYYSVAPRSRARSEFPNPNLRMNSEIPMTR